MALGLTNRHLEAQTEARVGHLGQPEDTDGPTRGHLYACDLCAHVLTVFVNVFLLSHVYLLFLSISMHVGHVELYQDSWDPERLK